MGDLKNLNEDLFMCTPPIRSEGCEKATKAASNLLPQRTKDLYEFAYKRFEKYMLENSIGLITESVMIEYMVELSKTVKSSSLWSYYSMLRGSISTIHQVDITKFDNLRNFLKQQNIGYKTKKSKIFTKNEFRKFLCAPDETYLMHKVAFIFGVAGACRIRELTYLTTDNIEDLGKAILVKLDNRTDKRRSFIVPGKYMEYYRKYAILRPGDVSDKRFFLSYRFGKCTRQVVGVNKFGSIPQEIASYLKLPDAKEYTGRCFRAISPTFLNDQDADGFDPNCDISSSKSYFGENVNSPKRDDTWGSSTVSQSYINDSVDIKAEVEDDMLNDFSSDISTGAENDISETSKLTNWVATDTASEDNSNPINISYTTSSTIELKGLKRPIFIENCSDCKIIIS